MKIMRKLAAVGVIVALILGTSPPAEAHKDGDCNNGDLCMFILVDYVGSAIDYFYVDYNHANDRFLTDDVGQGQIVGRNSESAINYDLSHIAYIWNNYNCTGRFFSINVFRGAPDLGAMKNQNLSNCWRQV